MCQGRCGSLAVKNTAVFLLERKECAIFAQLAKALGYSEEIMQLLAEPKYDTMEELLEINRNRNRKRGV
jgi:hypothetical protein